MGWSELLMGGLGAGLLLAGGALWRLLRANAVLRRAAASAEAAGDAQSMYLHGLSHELRAPLSAIVGYSALLQRDLHGCLSPESAEDLRRIREAGEQLRGLLGDMLDLAALDAGEVDLHPGPLDLPALVAELHAATARLAERNRNRLRIELAPDLPELHTDAERLRQILLVLLANACAYTEDGEVEFIVGLRAQGVENGTAADGPEGQLVFTVRDTGIGMNREQLGRLFRPFVTVNPNRRGEGSGLSLAVAQRLATLMGGAISVTSAPGRGSTFTLAIPTMRSTHMHAKCQQVVLVS